MLRIFCLIFSAIVLFTQISFADTSGDFGGGNEQGNAGKSELCEKYNICIKVNSAKSKFLNIAVSSEGFNITLSEDSSK